jgi:hypothetical protein
MRRVALIALGSWLALAPKLTTLQAKSQSRSVRYSYTQTPDNYIVVSMSESSSGVTGTVFVNRYIWGGRYKKTFKVSQAEFDRIYSTLMSPDVEKHLINEKSEKLDLNNYYILGAGDQNYAIYRYGSSGKVSAVASQLRSYGDKWIDAGVPSLPEVYGARLVDFGIYQIQSTGKVQKAEGAWEVVPSTQLVEKTTSIPARLNTNFGIRYSVTGLPKGAPVDITIQVTHPAITNPKTGKAKTVEKYTLPLRIGVTDYRGVTFKSPADMVPGPWVFEIFVGKDILLKKKFEVRAAN